MVSKLITLYGITRSLTPERNCLPLPGVISCLSAPMAATPVLPLTSPVKILLVETFNRENVKNKFLNHSTVQHLVFS